MKLKILTLCAAAALLAGCAETRQHFGASGENDRNVLSGGPVTGTTIADLPQPVKDTLQQKVPHAEIADIDKSTRNGKLVYAITFAEPGKNPTMYVTEDGKIWSEADLQK